MKLIITAFTVLFSLSALASWNEVECEGRIDQKLFQVEVELPFPHDSVLKPVTLTISENGAVNSFNYIARTRVTRGFNEVRFTADGLDLEVSYWPDMSPRWGHKYSGILRSAELGNQSIYGLTCRFPNAN